MWTRGFPTTFLKSSHPVSFQASNAAGALPQFPLPLLPVSLAQLCWGSFLCVLQGIYFHAAGELEALEPEDRSSSRLKCPAWRCLQLLPAPRSFQAPAWARFFMERATLATFPMISPRPAL